MTVESGGLLNSAQQRRLRITCEYVDKLLTDIENELHSTDSKSPFPKYIADLSPLQQKIIQDYIARIRARFVRALESQSIEREHASIPLTRLAIALRTYSSLPTGWLQGLIRGIKEFFQSHADTYRAQLDRELGAQRISPAEMNSIQKDLEALGQPAVTAAD